VSRDRYLRRADASVATLVYHSDRLKKIGVMRAWAFFGMCSYCIVASAAVTCEQLAAVGTTAQQLRDQGNSLSVVMSEISKLETDGKFTGADMVRIKDVATLTFSGMLSPREVMRECAAAKKR
jgi:hypothetical protein